MPNNQQIGKLYERGDSVVKFYILHLNMDKEKYMNYYMLISHSIKTSDKWGDYPVKMAPVKSWEILNK